MKHTITLITALSLATPLWADAHLDGETIEKIEALLTEMECQMDTDDIEVSEDGYELDDVICKGGLQFDINLDKELNETSRRAE